LDLYVTKQDTNMYDGADELSIVVSTLTGEELAAVIIPDDGVSAGEGLPGPLQTRRILLSSLENGTYRIVLDSPGDLTVRQIRINTGKLVVGGRSTLVGMNEVYFDNPLLFDPLAIYYSSSGRETARIMTTHTAGIQTLYMLGKNSSQELSIDARSVWYNITLDEGAFALLIEKQDLTIDLETFFSFTPGSYFTPQRVRTVPLERDIEWARENVDYLVVDLWSYSPPIVEDGWLVIQAEWPTRELFVENDELVCAITVSPFDGERRVALDWVRFEIILPPLWERV